MSILAKKFLELNINSEFLKMKVMYIRIERFGMQKN